MKEDINKIPFIYFYSPNGTWTRIHKNLIHMGLSKNKKIGSTYTRNFINEVNNDSFLKQYEAYDVIYLDEFYDYEFSGEEEFIKVYNAMNDLILRKKQIVMAGHDKLERIYLMPEEMRSRVVSFDLNYDLGFDTDIQYINDSK